MHRRFLFPLAAGVVGLVAISPVFAAEPSPAKAGSGPAKATTTTAAPKGGSPSNAGPSGNTGSSGGNGTTATTSGGNGSSTPASSGPGAAPGQGGGGSAPAPGSSSNCAPPQTDQAPAPQVGEPPQNHPAGDAGTVDVERLSATDLRVAKASPNDGWTQQATAPSGPRVTVKFTHAGGSPSVIRFAASMDQAGRMIHTRVQACG
jgi:hypothetical protein